MPVFDFKVSLIHPKDHLKPATAAYIKQWANARKKTKNQKPKNQMRNHPPWDGT